MPNPYNNKVQLADGTVLIDLSSDTLSSADQLMQGVVAHDRTGAVITGTGSGGVDGDELGYGYSAPIVGVAIVGVTILPSTVGDSLVGSAVVGDLSASVGGSMVGISTVG